MHFESFWAAQIWWHLEDILPGSRHTSYVNFIVWVLEQKPHHLWCLLGCPLVPALVLKTPGDWIYFSQSHQLGGTGYPPKAQHMEVFVVLAFFNRSMKGIVAFLLEFLHKICFFSKSVGKVLVQKQTQHTHHLVLQGMATPDCKSLDSSCFCTTILVPACDRKFWNLQQGGLRRCSRGKQLNKCSGGWTMSSHPGHQKKQLPFHPFTKTKGSDALRTCGQIFHIYMSKKRIKFQGLPQWTSRMSSMRSGTMDMIRTLPCRQWKLKVSSSHLR